MRVKACPLKTLAILVCVTLSAAATADVGGLERAVPTWPDWQDLYVGDFHEGRIYRITSDRTAEVYAEGIPGCNQLVFDQSGVLFVAGGASIWKITPTPDGTPATRENGHVTAFFSGLHHARALTRDLQGNLWVTEYWVRQILDENGKPFSPPRFVQGGLYKVSPAGKKTVVEAPMKWPYGLATGPDGNIYLAQLGDGFNLFKYTPDGERTLVAKGIYWLRNVAFHPEGNLWALGGHGIVQVAQDGTKKPFYEWQSGKKLGKHPVGLAFDANGTLYSSAFTEDVNAEDNRGFIFQYAPDAARTVFCRVGKKPEYMAFYPSEAPADRSQCSEEEEAG